MDLQFWSLARLPLTGKPWEHNSTEEWSSGNTRMIPACKGKGSNRFVRRRTNNSINTVHILSMVVLSMWHLVVIFDTCKRILQYSCLLNFLIPNMYLERTIMSIFFHRAKAAFFRLAHVPMAKKRSKPDCLSCKPDCLICLFWLLFLSNNPEIWDPSG